jgi:nicotinate-nucleotide pyrophosphorylase (carboxylating)
VKREALITQVLRKVRRAAPQRFLEVEVTNLSELRAALQAKPDAILLDNWRLSGIRKAVRLRDTLHASRFTKLEVSGGVTLANVRAIAKTGVDRISIGRLTHSAPALDVSLGVM